MVDIVEKNTLRTKGFLGLYSGATALIIGNGAKSAVRFTTYDHIKHLLADDKVTTILYSYPHSCY